MAVHSEVRVVKARDGGTSLLARSWWVVFPVFAAIALRLAVERTCGDPYELMPALTSSARWAWPLALLYLAAHAWSVAAYLLTVARADTLLPPLAAWRRVWGGDVVKIVLMLAMLAIESAPIGLWRMIGAAAGCAE